MTTPTATPAPTRRVLTCFGTAATFTVALVAPAALAGQQVEGRVLESNSRQPVMLASVALMDTSLVPVDVTVTDEAGHFTLSAPEPGLYFVLAGRLGYHHKLDGVLELGRDGYLEVTFYLRPLPVQLEGITAVAQRVRTQRNLERNGFYDRRRAGFGHFVTPEEVLRQRPHDAQTLLRDIPYIRVGTLEEYGTQEVVCNGRDPQLWVDGNRVNFTRLPSVGSSTARPVLLEDVAAVEDIAAVEVYTRASQLPPQYGGTGDWAAGADGGMQCVILIWTWGG